MPSSSFHLARLLVASGLLVLATFASARAQEVPLDPNLTDIPLAEEQTAGFEPVSQLAVPENDCPNCAPAPQAWYPPIYYPKPELYCPTGVVHRDWWREKTIGFHVNRRQRMLEKDYQWRVQNGLQPPCCPPHSCWGHTCDDCNGIGCRNGWGCLNGSGECQCNPCQCAPVEAALEPAAEPLPIPSEHAVTPLSLPSEHAAALESEVAPIMLPAIFDDAPAGEILLVSGDQPVAEAGIETAGFCEIGDSCAPAAGSYGYPAYGSGYCYPSYGYSSPYSGSISYGEWEDCDECDDDDCDCPICCLKGRWCHFHHGLCRCLFADGHHGPRNLPPIGHYNIAYPVNPHHFDQRDGRIYAAQGYGHPVAVPLAPNVEHTYNYGWGVPSSRLSPVSRMPGAPGVANPAVPGAAGPGIFPPVSPQPWVGGSMGLGR